MSRVNLPVAAVLVFLSACSEDAPPQRNASDFTIEDLAIEDTPGAVLSILKLLH